MLRSWPIVLMVYAFLIFQGCRRDLPVTVSITEFALGTTVDITVVATDSARAYNGIRRATAELHRIGFDFWEGEPNGALGRLNSERRTGNRELIALIDQALAFGQMTAGAFDIRIGQISESYGFITKESYVAVEHDRLDRLVNAARLLEFAGSDSVRFLTGSDATLTLGGIAKGYAVDRAVEILMDAGCPAGVVNAGGDLKVWGGTVDKPWHIGIEDPQTGGILQKLLLLDGALATSGDYHNRFYSDSTLIHHIVDPGSGRSANPMHSSSVYAPDCTTADALATAFLVLGEESTREIAGQMDRIGILQLRPDYTIWHNRYMVGVISEWDYRI
jgi:thiamine biosynthesis lipoprotein